MLSGLAIFLSGNNKAWADDSLLAIYSILPADTYMLCAKSFMHTLGRERKDGEVVPCADELMEPQSVLAVFARVPIKADCTLSAYTRNGYLWSAILTSNSAEDLLTIRAALQENADRVILQNESRIYAFHHDCEGRRETLFVYLRDRLLMASSNRKWLPVPLFEKKQFCLLRPVWRELAAKADICLYRRLDLPASRSDKTVPSQVKELIIDLDRNYQRSEIRFFHPGIDRPEKLVSLPAVVNADRLAVISSKTCDGETVMSLRPTMARFGKHFLVSLVMHLGIEEDYEP